MVFWRSVRGLGWLWLCFGLCAIASGCTGDPYLFIAGPSKAPVGEVVGFGLSTNAPCYTSPFGGPSDPANGFHCSRPSHLKEVLDVACDDGACTVENISPPDETGVIGVIVVGSQAGDTVLRARARTTDGTELSNTFPISFVVATDLRVLCDGTLTTAGLMIPPSGQCGGHYPVFTDSAWQWKLAFASPAGDLFASSVTANVVGGDAVTGSLAGVTLTLRSGSSPGMVEVQLSSRQFMKNIPVRVVSLADVVSGELQMVSDGSVNDGINQDIASLGPAPTTLWYGDRHYRLFDGDTGNISIRPLLTLADGSTVFGGGGLFVPDDPDLLSIYGLDGGGTQLQLTKVQPWIRGAGNTVVSATIGAAQITWPIQIVNRLDM